MITDTLCPKCVGAKEIMTTKKEGRGFIYSKCNLCDGKGYVNSELEEDYILSLDEESINDYDD